ncbi:MAG: hypothetical protein LBB19_03960 [Puniceicoccales bacterium]|jgi:hypothetical protein|nr:hypothetical protein [Puniceicoccales bacterium]
MKWKKKGVIYCPNGEAEWMQHSFLTPTPVLMDDKIRLFGGIRDKDGVSRIGFIDVSAENPSNVLYVHKEPVLDIGEDGCFDDNGIILGTILYDHPLWRMYYVGFQLVNKVKFFAFSGLAYSNDLQNFKRHSQTPIMDRRDGIRFIAGIHSILKEDNKYKVWYAGGNGWEIINGLPYPRYSIFYIESPDGCHFDFKSNMHLIKPTKNEYRIGRPTIYKIKNKYIMFTTYDTLKKEYKMAYFESFDGMSWERKDEEVVFIGEKTAWDLEMMCYLTLLKYGQKTYLFYNGNGMGKTGVGYAELLEN